MRALIIEQPMNADKRTSFAGVKMVLGLLVLHALTCLRYQWEEATFAERWLRINPDLILLLALFLVLVLRFGCRSLFTHLLSIAALFVPIYRFGYTVMPIFYGQAFDPYNDILLVPSLIHLLLHEHAPWFQWLAITVAALAVVLLYALVFYSARSVLRAGLTPRRNFTILILCQVLIIGGWIEESLNPANASVLKSKSMYAEIVTDVSELLENRKQRAAFEAQMDEAVMEQAELDANLDGLKGADVYIFFIESYGRALFRKAENARTFENFVEPLDEQLQAGGFQTCSTFCFPSVRGGGSTLAHAELLSGIKVKNRHVFSMLLKSRLKPLPRYFTDAGYRTINAQPATTEDWEDGKFFGFANDSFQDSYPYDGIIYHWGLMPDQFALDYLLRNEVLPSARPIFLQYISVTSHAPFVMIPPYYQDWNTVREPGSYSGEPEKRYPIHWMNYANHPQLTEAYLDTIHYTLKTLVGFTLEHSRPSLSFILGDHQPPTVGDLMQGEDTRHVPLHVIANRDYLIKPFLQRGFREGLVPTEGTPRFSTSRFLYYFLSCFTERDDEFPGEEGPPAGRR